MTQFNIIGTLLTLAFVGLLFLIVVDVATIFKIFGVIFCGTIMLLTLSFWSQSDTVTFMLGYISAMIWGGLVWETFAEPEYAAIAVTLVIIAYGIVLYFVVRESFDLENPAAVLTTFALIAGTFTYLLLTADILFTVIFSTALLISFGALTLSKQK